MSTPARLSTLLDQALDEVVALYALPGYAPPLTTSLPDRQYWTIGNVALDDCGQLVVTGTAINEGLPVLGNVLGNADGVADFSPYALSFSIGLVRCLTTMDDRGNPPSPAQIEADNASIAADGWMLTVGLRKAHFDSAAFLGGCQNLHLVQAIPIGPEGAQAGWQVDWQVTV